MTSLDDKVFNNVEPSTLCAKQRSKVMPTQDATSTDSIVLDEEQVQQETTTQLLFHNSIAFKICLPFINSKLL